MGKELLMPKYIAITISALIITLFVQTSASSLQTSNDIEAQAMASLGYKVVQQTSAYPNDRYAMPEPYAYESLVLYKFAGKVDTLIDSHKFASTQ